MNTPKQIGVFLLFFFFNYFWEQVFSAIKLASAAVFCWDLQDLAKLLPKLYSFMLYCLGSSGSLMFPGLAADKLRLFVQILPILGKHLERRMRM